MQSSVGSGDQQNDNNNHEFHRKQRSVGEHLRKGLKFKTSAYTATENEFDAASENLPTGPVGKTYPSELS